MKYLLKSVFKYTLIAVLIYSCVYKVALSEEFEIKLFQSDIIPNDLIPFLIVLIPLIELIVILLLLFYKEKIALISSLSLLSTYTVYLIYLNDFSLYNGCSCGGIFEQLTYSQHVLVNIILILINVFALFNSNISKKSSDKLNILREKPISNTQP